jgi:phytoene dehydrogenase-like protein
MRNSAGARSVKNYDPIELEASLTRSEIPPTSVNVILKPLHFQVAVRLAILLIRGNLLVPNPDVLIVGGGLAGLCCALHLHQSGRNFLLLEGSDQIGGRIRTDLVDGFRFDHGFQVLLTSYPEVRRILDLDSLGLRPFRSGAIVRIDAGFARITDPFRNPLSFISALRSPIGTLGDKLRIARWRRRLRSAPIDEIWRGPQTTAGDALTGLKFSPGFIDSFFRPFLRGVFLEPALETSSRAFEFVMKMFALGDAALPSGGMGAIPEQIAARLPAGSIRTQSPVASIIEGGVELDGGERIQASASVIATEGLEASRLLGEDSKRRWNAVRCLYFASDQPPIKEPFLVLNGTGRGPINNLCVPSQIAPSYAPAGKSLISVSVLGTGEAGDRNLLASVREQLAEWFGETAAAWRHLRTYTITNALPSQSVADLEPVIRPTRLRGGLYVCGDHRDSASIQGAMESGRRAAESLLRDFPAAARTDPPSPA